MSSPLSDFESFVTHGFRTPLSRIRWMLELAQQSDRPAEVASCLEHAHASVRQLIALVDEYRVRGTATAADATRADGRSSRARGVSSRILLAEDDRFLRRAAETALSKRGHTVLLAVDGHEALEQARTHRPDLVLLDLMMPRQTGLQVLEALRADPATRDITVLMLSNSSNELDVHAAKRLGVAGYWIKANLSLQELCDRVEKALALSPGRMEGP